MSGSAAAPLSPRAAVAPQLHRLLRNRIVSCELAPGERISETDIASTYNVSRQPVREAFIKLSEEQLVGVRPQRGTFVRRISVSAVLIARFIREAVEADIARRVAERATPDIVAQLEAQLNEQQRVADTEDQSEFIHVDEAFHRLLAQLSGAPPVSDHLEVLNVQVNRVRNISAREFAPEQLIVQHRAIVDAIRAHDAKAADAAMRVHLQKLNRDLPQIVATYPDYFTDVEALE